MGRKKKPCRITSKATAYGRFKQMNKEKVRAELRAALAWLRLLASWLAAALPDLLGMLGLTMLGRGIWLQFGAPWALMVVGGLLVVYATAAALRGER